MAVTLQASEIRAAQLEDEMSLKTKKSLIVTLTYFFNFQYYFSLQNDCTVAPAPVALVHWDVNFDEYH